MDIQLFHSTFGKKIVIGIILLTLAWFAFLLFYKETVTVIINSPAPGVLTVPTKDIRLDLATGENSFTIKAGTYHIEILADQYKPISQEYIINRNPYFLDPSFEFALNMKEYPEQVINNNDSIMYSNLSQHMPVEIPDLSFIEVPLITIEFNDDASRAIGTEYTSQGQYDEMDVQLYAIDLSKRKLEVINCFKTLWIDTSTYLCAQQHDGAIKLSLVNNGSTESITSLYDFQDIVWEKSPDSQYVTLSDTEFNETTNVFLLNLFDNSLEKATFAGWVSKVKWTTDSKGFFYNRWSSPTSIDDELWYYDINKQENSLVANFSITNFAFESGNSAYLVAQGLKDSGSEASDFAQLQEQLTQDVVNYVNTNLDISLDLMNKDDITLYRWDIEHREYQAIGILEQNSDYFVFNVDFLSEGYLRVTLARPVSISGGDSADEYAFRYLDLQL